MPRYDVSVVIGTHNRDRSLGGALDAVLRQQTGGTSYEIVVVDNNSTDETAMLVSSLLSRHPDLRYVFERRQGLSYARNAGIDASRAPIVAFTDDDIRVRENWVEEMASAFRERSDVDCVAGRILPRWPFPPPSWLTRRHWVGPLALQDYGDEPFVVTDAQPVCLAGANFAFRRDVFERVGGFSPAFPRSQDVELLVRFWRAGGRALYAPGVVVEAEVQPERMTKAYHRRWHAANGRFSARMRLNETTAADGRLLASAVSSRTLFGVPGFVYRQLVAECFHWLRTAPLGDRGTAFAHETVVHHLLGYIAARSADWRSRGPGTPPAGRTTAAGGEFHSR